MLATLTRDRFFHADWIYERKFDGERCIAYSQAHSVALMTRNQKDVSATYPEVCAALAAQAATGFVVDGEVVALDRGATSFSRLQQRLGVRSPSAQLLRAVPVVYFVFDVMRTDGSDVRELPVPERKQVLKALLSYGGPVRYTAHRADPPTAQAYWDRLSAAAGKG